jgi:type IV pilus assembly protein PilB
MTPTSFSSTTTGMQEESLAAFLREEQILSEEELERALRRTEETQRPLEEILREEGFIARDLLERTIAEYYRIPPAGQLRLFKAPRWSSLLRPLLQLLLGDVGAQNVLHTLEHSREERERRQREHAAIERAQATEEQRQQEKQKVEQLRRREEQRKRREAAARLRAERSAQRLEALRRRVNAAFNSYDQTAAVLKKQYSAWREAQKEMQRKREEEHRRNAERERARREVEKRAQEEAQRRKEEERRRKEEQACTEKLAQQRAREEKQRRVEEERRKKEEERKQQALLERAKRDAERRARAERRAKRLRALFQPYFRFRAWRQRRLEERRKRNEERRARKEAKLRAKEEERRRCVEKEALERAKKAEERRRKHELRWSWRPSSAQPTEEKEGKEVELKKPVTLEEQLAEEARREAKKQLLIEQEKERLRRSVTRTTAKSSATQQFTVGEERQEKEEKATTPEAEQALKEREQLLKERELELRIREEALQRSVQQGLPPPTVSPSPQGAAAIPAAPPRAAAPSPPPSLLSRAGLFQRKEQKRPSFVFPSSRAIQPSVPEEVPSKKGQEISEELKAETTGKEQKEEEKVLQAEKKEAPKEEQEGKEGEGEKEEGGGEGEEGVNIGQILLAQNYLSETELKEAQKQAKKRHLPIEMILKEEGLVTRELIQNAIAEYYKVPFIDIRAHAPDPSIVELLPKDLAISFNAVAVERKEDGTVIVATSSPERSNILEELKKAIPSAQNISLAYAPREAIDAALAFYQKPLMTRFRSIIEQRKKVAPEIIEEIFNDAVQLGASDIHFEPQETVVIVRFRVDGVMHEAGRIPKEYYEGIVNRIKIAGNMRIDEHFSAQDGAIRWKGARKYMDVRVSIVPIVDGEKIVMRLLSEYVRTLTLNDLGFTSEHTDLVLHAAHKPFGMVLATGPTGSGKSTTLYGLLKIRNTPDVNISTIEDPVEYKVPGINHIQVNPKTGLTFDKGLRAIVRQDPNIILVGEIRDNITAQIAVNAALTGHLLFSTLHANDAATAVPRLLDMEIEPFLLASTLELVIAQRLMRRICTHCRYSHTISYREACQLFPQAEHYFSSEEKDVTLYHGKGCGACGNTGYKGRIGVYELLEVTPELEELIVQRRTTAEINNLAREQGMLTLFEDGLKKVAAGLSTIEELLRIASPPEYLESS